MRVFFEYFLGICFVSGLVYGVDFGCCVSIITHSIAFIRFF